MPNTDYADQDDDGKTRDGQRRQISPVSRRRPANHRGTLRQPRRRSGRSMHTFMFRSYHLGVELDETDLVPDVRLDVNKARQN